MGGKKLYHAFDLAHGYHNLEIHPDDQAKTAIILPEDLGLPSRQFEFTRLSFGLSAAPGAFQCVTDRLITPAKEPKPENDLGDAVSVYLDDVCIAGDNFEVMLQRLEAFFNRVRASGFLLKAKKCELFQKEISYLGHKLSEHGIKADDKINKILHWARPNDQKELRSWLGLVNYYTKYVPHLATEASPLYELLRSKISFEWTEQCEQSFKRIKQLLTTPPVLGTPDVTKGPFTLTSDASLTGLGAVLSQEQNGKDVTIAYWSKILNTAQRNYCATHRELLALVESVKAFNHYLAGAPFLVKSDHAALQWLKSFKNPTGMLARWLEKLAPYQFQVVYVKGTSIGHADALSRRPQRPCEKDCIKCTKIENLKTLPVSVENVMVNWGNIVADGLTPEQLRKDQILDDDIMPIMVAVQEGKRPDFQDIVGFSNKTRTLWHQFKSLVIRDGLLFRKFVHITREPEKDQYQLVLPSKHVKNTVKHYHEQLGEVNHFGIHKTVAHMQRFFWWPGMQNDIQWCLYNCLVCNRFKGVKHRVKPPMKIFQDGVLHGRWHVDIAGPFKASEEGYTYILVAVEAFSGWPVVVPLRGERSTEVAKALVTHVFSVFGSPISMMTDQGKNMLSETMREVANLYQIKKYKISVKHPQANGKVERWIKTLKLQLALLIGNNPLTWPDYLPFIAQAYRSLPNEVTKCSPYEIMFGAPMRTPLHMERGTPPCEDDWSHYKTAYPLFVREALTKIHDIVRESKMQAAKRMKQLYDKTAMLSPFKVGDKVYYYKKNTQRGVMRKLTSPWLGPFTVTDIINDCNAQIQDDAPPYTKMIVHIDKLAAYTPQDSECDLVTAAWLTFI
ncbi:hypothetical protein ONE63_011441 [Megalurothrips usitatus]|uniref:RNA-directed DNA polymerase n=1 Tax=Megalurothrips usitatus TaxID=439358 RepID=A0AAV7WZB5_9NEOP|nr:hypothetical protein ONE63_011441 [Megalurothrips usitatus]